MRSRLLLLLACVPLAAQTPAWKEFAIGPATRKPVRINDVVHGALHANSISLRSLIAIAAGIPAYRIIGPDWIETDFYSVSATISDQSLRLRTRSDADASVAADFRSLLTRELARRFRLEWHREMQDRLAYTLRRDAGSPWRLRQAKESERGRIEITGTPITNATAHLDAKGAALETLCSRLQRILKAPVAPDPSLPEGAWDFRLQWKTGDPASLFAALRNQLGLELVEESRRQEYLIVDRVERPPLPPSAAAGPGDSAAGNRDPAPPDRPPWSAR